MLVSACSVDFPQPPNSNGNNKYASLTNSPQLKPYPARRKTPDDTHPRTFCPRNRRPQRNGAVDHKTVSRNAFNDRNRFNRQRTLSALLPGIRIEICDLQRDALDPTTPPNPTLACNCPPGGFRVTRGHVRMRGLVEDRLNKFSPPRGLRQKNSGKPHV